jgi:putative transcriptional regulator
MERNGKGVVMSKIMINLERVLSEKQVSKTQLCYACKLQRTQLNNYCKNKVTRIDLNTLAKICDYLNCDVNEILVIEKEM